MREILFRGKRLCDGRWTYGSLIKFDRQDVVFAADGDFRGAYDVDPATVGQYTGLTDKNGVKIFEGDILKGAWGECIVVYYDDCYLGFRVRNKTGRENDVSYYDNGRLVVAGNIYDNTELLEVRVEQSKPL